MYKKLFKSFLKTFSVEVEVRRPLLAYMYVCMNVRQVYSVLRTVKYGVFIAGHSVRSKKRIFHIKQKSRLRNGKSSWKGMKTDNKKNKIIQRIRKRTADEEI